MGVEEVLQRIQKEYVALPGLRLTVPQAQRLWDLDSEACNALLGALVDAKFLVQTREGTFVRADRARPASLPSHERQAIA